MARILYVDDDPDLRAIAEMALGLDPDFVVRSCDGGAAALALVGEWRPDLILLDVMMPGMDGPATLAALRAHPSANDVPVAFITARSQSRDLEQLMALGPRTILAKPFDAMTLATQVRALLGSAST